MYYDRYRKGIYYSIFSIQGCISKCLLFNIQYLKHIYCASNEFDRYRKGIYYSIFSIQGSVGICLLFNIQYLKQIYCASNEF